MPQATPSGRQSPDSQARISARPNALRELRLRRFWTQADLAAAFEARSRQIGRPLSLSVRQVRRWESERPPLPLPAYQAVLEALFGVPIERMGFQPEWTRAAPPARVPAWGGGTPDGFAQEWGAGVTRSTQDDPGRQDPVKRREFMTGAVALGSGALASVPPARRPHDPDPAALAGYGAIADQYRALYWSVPATSLFHPVAAHCELGLGLVGAARSPGARARLAGPLAESAMLAGRLAFFDLRHPELAERYYLTGLDAALEAGDRALTAAVLTHLAFVPAYAGHAKRARELMERARQEARAGVGATQRSWMYAVAAELEAKLGDAEASADLIARSEVALSCGGRPGGPDPHWLDFFDESRHAGFKGFCQLNTGRFDDAARSLEGTLRALPADSAKQRSVTLADLAQARARQGELAESSRLLCAAIGQLERQWYAIGADRVDAVRRGLAAHAPVSLLAPVDQARRELERNRR